MSNALTTKGRKQRLKPMKLYPYILLFLICLGVASCATRNAVNNAAHPLQSITDRADRIITKTDQIRDELPDSSPSTIDNNLDDIVVESEGIKGDAKTVNDIVKDNSKEILTLREEIQALRIELAELRASNASLLRRLLAWVSVISMVGIGACVALGLALRTKAAFLIGSAFLVVLGLAVTLTLYMQAIALASLVALGVVALGAATYWAVVYRKRDKALVEVVQTIEKAKTEMPEEAKAGIFADDGLANSVQSPSTQKVVKEIRTPAA
jgi:uncharacterized membrane protein YphA (DoxX/SURF4 family)